MWEKVLINHNALKTNKKGLSRFLCEIKTEEYYKNEKQNQNKSESLDISRWGQNTRILHLEWEDKIIHLAIPYRNSLYIQSPVCIPQNGNWKIKIHVILKKTVNIYPKQLKWNCSSLLLSFDLKCSNIHKQKIGNMKKINSHKSSHPCARLQIT